eukprot:12916836-Prorocentrum_lima.AAC.1
MALRNCCDGGMPGPGPHVVCPTPVHASSRAPPTSSGRLAHAHSTARIYHARPPPPAARPTAPTPAYTPTNHCTSVSRAASHPPYVP